MGTDAAMDRAVDPKPQADPCRDPQAVPPASPPARSDQMIHTIKELARKNETVFRSLKDLKDRAQPARDFLTTHFGNRDGRRFARAGDYFAKKQVAGYIGWVGNGNLGDEALYA